MGGLERHKYKLENHCLSRRQGKRKTTKKKYKKAIKETPRWIESSALDIDQLLLDTVDHTEHAIELRLMVVGRGGRDKCSSRDDKLGEVFCHDCVMDGGISRIMQPNEL